MRMNLDDIDPDTLPRDRTHLDEGALDELQRSILATGLRVPIEVCKLGTDDKGGHGLISGHRRLTVFKRLRDQGLPAFAEIPVTLRKPENFGEALTMMVEENDLRADLSPWEKSAIALRAVEMGEFETLDGAIAALYIHAAPRKRRRLRAIADVVEHFDGALDNPEALSQKALDRLGTCLRNGWSDLLDAAIEGKTDHAHQWLALKSVLDEHDILPPEARSTPNDPIRFKRMQVGGARLSIRRERTKSGYSLHLTGPIAKDKFITDVFDQIEYWLTSEE